MCPRREGPPRAGLLSLWLIGLIILWSISPTVTNIVRTHLGGRRDVSTLARTHEMKMLDEVLTVALVCAVSSSQFAHLHLD
jgi:hypothetical protein